MAIGYVITPARHSAHDGRTSIRPTATIARNAADAVSSATSSPAAVHEPAASLGIARYARLMNGTLAAHSSPAAMANA